VNFIAIPKFFCTGAGDYVEDGREIFDDETAENMVSFLCGCSLKSGVLDSY